MRGSRRGAMGATLLQRAEDRRQINVDEGCNLGLGDEQMTPQTFVGGESAVQCRRGLTEQVTRDGGSDCGRKIIRQMKIRNCTSPSKLLFEYISCASEVLWLRVARAATR